MSESTSSSTLTTAQIAGVNASDAPPAPPETVPSGAGMTADPANADGDSTEDRALQGRASGQGSPLLADNAGFTARWAAIQTTFVDEPRTAVESADALVAEVMSELARTFAEERARLEGAWSRGTDVSTEDLRQVLQRYRDFFHLLLRS
jgi:hypothetical protein